MSELKRAQVDEFFESGFTVVRDVFTDKEIAEMRAAFDRLERTAARLSASTMVRGSQFVLRPRPGGPPAIQRVVWCGAAEPVLSRYGRDPRLLKPAALLLGSRVMHQLINQAHFKLPGDEVSFPWHQDSTHRRYGGSEWKDVNGNGSYVQSVTAVDRIRRDNGPLELIPGSCKLGHLGLRDDGALPADVDARAAISIAMDPGSVVFFGPYTIHRSRPNRSDTPRRVLINGFACPGANSRTYPGQGADRRVALGGQVSF
jgi:ectoine hydroxylase-related dioxygenase (phytanoyl-CoA dioxygenase family)